MPIRNDFPPEHNDPWDTSSNDPEPAPAPQSQRGARDYSVTKPAVQTPTVDIATEIDSPKARERIAQVWGGKRTVNVDRFIDGALRAIYKVGKAGEKLRNCDIHTIKDSLLDGAECGLYTDDQGGEFDLVPRSGNCTMQLNYRGWRQRALETGRFRDIFTDVIHENDHVELVIGSPSVYKRTFNYKNPGMPIAYVAYAEDLNGKLYPPMVMTVSQIEEECREHSDSYKYRTEDNPGPWITHPDQMSRKSVLLKFCKQFAETDTERVLTRDEYREAGFEQISDVPLVALETKSVSASATSATLPPEGPEGKDLTPLSPPSQPVAETQIPTQKQPTGPFAPPATVHRTPAPNARHTLLQADLGEALMEFCEDVILPSEPAGTTLDAVKRKFAVNYFPKGVTQLSALSDLDCYLLGDCLCQLYDARAREYGPKLTEFCRMYADFIDRAVRDWQRKHGA